MKLFFPKIKIFFFIKICLCFYFSLYFYFNKLVKSKLKLKKMKLSVVIPVYNSSKILNKLSFEINSYLEPMFKGEFEIIFVNDCSTDESWIVIKTLTSKYNFIKGINLENNVGQHGAIFIGLTKCKGDRIILMDDDLQHPPSFLLSIYKKLDHCDVCYTIYKKRKHVLWKVLISSTNNIFSSFIFNKPFNIYLSSLKGLNKNIKDSFINSNPDIPFIDSLILKNTDKISNVEIVHQDRLEGTTNYDLKKLFILWFDMIENFHFYPIRFGSLIGILSYGVIKVIRMFKKKKFSYSIKEMTF